MDFLEPIRWLFLIFYPGRFTHGDDNAKVLRLNATEEGEGRVFQLESFLLTISLM